MAQTLLALLPVIILLPLIYKSDSAEREPIKLIALCFILGVASTLIVCLIETLICGVIDITLDPSSIASILLTNVIGIALIEELGKMGAAMLPTWKNKQFNYVFDGVVYCATAALGFAALENIMYVFMAGSSFVETGALRGVISVPGHMFDGIVMGIFLGFAKYYKYENKQNRKKLCIALSLILPIIEHGAFDALASSGSAGSSAGVIGITIFNYVVGIAIVLRFRGKRDIRINLPVATVAAPQPAPAPAIQSMQQPTPAPAPQPTQASNFCGQCGSPISPTDKFCSNCGAKK